MHSIKCNNCSHMLLTIILSWTEGLFKELQYSCSNCNHTQKIANSTVEKISLNKKNNGYRQINLQTNLVANTSGQTYVNYSHFMNGIGLNAASRTSFYKMSDHVWRNAKKIGLQSLDDAFEEALNHLSNRLIISCNGAWLIENGHHH